MKKLEQFILRTIAGEHVMMPVGPTAQKFSGLINANDVSAFIWQHIEEVSTAEEMARLVTGEFEVSYEEALADTAGLIENMKKAGWIED